MIEVLAPQLLILASAGSGKTYQLSNRIIGLVAKGADPEHIVALTFTRKAAAEFADTVLTKLAKAASDPQAAAVLEKELGLSGVDFSEVLSKISRSLHRITLGTMDSFFSRIVKAFQYELGLVGGRFDLIEGPRQEIATDGILQHILGEVFSSTHGGEFSHAFRRASAGREQQGVARNLREFIKNWHLLYRQKPHFEWGPNDLISHKPEEWERSKQGLANQAMDGIEAIQCTPGQLKALKESIAEIIDHTIAGGRLGGDIGALTKSIIEAVTQQHGDTLTVKFRKEFEITGTTAIALRKLVTLAAQCELSATAMRSRAVHEVIAAYDEQCELLLRTRGRLGFDDIKLLMGEWVNSEEARLRREAIDFRLDARIDHWLLDEFQDTSPAEWNGLLPLIDEAISDEEKRSMFIVGDRKQAIYAWRGGDVTLFDQVIEHYGSNSASKLKIAELNESWRSCPEVLELVNEVCCDKPTLETIFGEAGRDWKCPAHESAPPLRNKSKRGHARVEMTSDWDEKFERMQLLLKQLGVGERELSCGILLRRNDTAAKVANELRSRGFDVILEGQRKPSVDSLIGVTIGQLLRWLADPGNQLARGVLEMSPLHPLLAQRHGDDWNGIWNALTSSITTAGYRATIDDLVRNCGIQWAPYNQRRIDDILQALSEIERRGSASCREVADSIERLSIPQSPGVAAIQVMTIHKSKGLGFDVVLLPDISNKVIPEANRFRVMQDTDPSGNGWLSEAPPQWVRQMHPELLSIEQTWGQRQQHEAMCMLYVALTRAKRGLYVMLDKPSKNHDFNKPSLANWLMRAVGLDALDTEEPWERGSVDWALDIDLLKSTPVTETIPELPTPKLEDHHLAQLTPSSLGTHGRNSVEGMAFGSEVHRLLEGIAWLDENSPTLPNSPAGKACNSLLQNETTRPFFTKGSRDIRLLREQSIDADVGGRWISGIIDRLHLHHDAEGKVKHIEIIDFKTDAVDETATLMAAYGPQIEAYREAVQELHPNATIDCILLSTHLHQAITL